MALARGESATVDGLKPVLHLTVNASVANGAGLPPGRVIGFVEARPIRIGEVADFGFTRRPHFFAARNPQRVCTLTLTDCDTHNNWPPEAFKPFLAMAAAGGTNTAD